MLPLAIFYSPSKGPKVPCTKKSLYKMEALTIKTFKTSKIPAVEVSERHSKDFNYKSIRFAYDRSTSYKGGWELQNLSV